MSIAQYVVKNTVNRLEHSTPIAAIKDLAKQYRETIRTTQLYNQTRATIIKDNSIYYCISNVYSLPLIMSITKAELSFVNLHQEVASVKSFLNHFTDCTVIEANKLQPQYIEDFKLFKLLSSNLDLAFAYFSTLDEVVCQVVDEMSGRSAGIADISCIGVFNDAFRTGITAEDVKKACEDKLKFRISPSHVARLSEIAMGYHLIKE